MPDITKLNPQEFINTLAVELKAGWSVRTTDQAQNARVAEALMGLSDYADESMKLFAASAAALNKSHDHVHKLTIEREQYQETIADLKDEVAGLRLTLQDREDRLTRARKLMSELLNTVQENPSRSEVVEEIRLKLEAYK